MCATKIQNVAPCGHVSRCMSDPTSYRSAAGSSWHPASDLTTAKFALRKLEEAMAADVAIHVNNIEIIEDNKAIEEQLRVFMKEIGIPETYNERDHKSRARHPKLLTHNSGWVTDIHRFIRTSDGYDGQKSSYDILKVRYDKFLADATKKEEYDAGAKERETEALKKKREEDMKLAAILGRYGLGILSEWNDVLDELCNKNRLLNLAVAMEDTRNDWSEGCYRVRDALFTPSNPLEEEIISNVAPLCDDFDDGRVFRDCLWNYGEIYSIIEDRQLVADALEARSHIER